MTEQPGFARNTGVVTGAWERLSGTVKGSICLAAAGAAFVVIAAIVHWMSADIPLFQIAFLQQVVVVAMIGPGLAAGGWSRMRTARPWMHAGRSTATAAGILFGFLAVTHLPVAEVTTILFSRMAFTAVLAVLLLGEVVRRETWASVGLASLGVVLVLSPDPGRMNWYGLAAVASALGMSLTMLLTRYLRGESRDAVVGWQAIGLMVAFAAPAAFVWTPMQPAHWLGCAAIGVLLWLSQHLNVFAYRYGEANAIQPAEASRLLVAIGIDVAIFGMVPRLSTFLGAGVIVLAIGTAVGLLDRLLRGRRRDAEAGD